MSTILKEKVIKMLQENTGRSILDSGGAYGRHWERNIKQSSEIEFWDNLSVVSPSGFEYDELWGTIHIYHHLVNSLEWDEEVEELNNLWDNFESAEENEDKSWNTLMEEFWELHKDHPDFDLGNREKLSSGYTYNVENSLSQDFVYVVMGDFVFIQIHNGCDARGGFTRPVLFKFNDDFWNIEDYTIYCEKDSDHFWDKEGYDSFYTETEVDLAKVEIKFENKKALCPICGGELEMNKIYSE